MGEFRAESSQPHFLYVFKNYYCSLSHLPLEEEEEGGEPDDLGAQASTPHLTPSLSVSVSLHLHYAADLHLAGRVLGHLFLGGNISDDLWFILGPWTTALSPGATLSSGSS